MQIFNLLPCFRYCFYLCISEIFQIFERADYYAVVLALTGTGRNQVG